MVSHPRQGLTPSILRHSLTSLHPELMLPLNPCGHTACSVEGCTGTSHRMLGMPLPPAPTAAWVTTEGLENGRGTIAPVLLPGTEAVCSMHRQSRVSDLWDRIWVLLLFLSCHQ